jgi:GGDEF domain-containing protein
VLPRLASAEVELIAERLVDRIREPILVDGNVVAIGASVGLAYFDPKADDARRLLVKADVAMYAAKGNPEHSWLLFDESMRLPANTEQHLSTHVPGAAGEVASQP